MRYILKILFITLITCFAHKGYAQNKVIDSLRSQYKEQDLSDEKKVQLELQLSERFYFSEVFLDSTLHYAYKALDTAEELQDSKNKAHALYMIAVSYNEIDNKDKAIAFYMECETILKEEKMMVRLSNLYNNVGAIYDKNKEFDKALEYYGKALDISIKRGSLFTQAVNYTNVGGLYLDKRDFKKSKENLLLAIEKFDRAKIEHAPVNQFYADVLYELGDKEQAMEFSLKSYDIAKRKNLLERQLTSAQFLSKLYEEKDDYAKSLDYHKKLYELKDSLNGINKLSAIEKIELSNKIESQQKRLDQLKSKQKYMYLIYALVGMVVLLLIFFINRQRKINKMTAAIREAQMRLINSRLQK